MTKLYV